MRLRKKKERILCKNKERFAWKRVAHAASRRGALLSASICEIESIVKEFLKTLDRDFHLAVAMGQMNLKVEVY